MEPAEIISLEKFYNLQGKLGKVICTSGGFDPIHPGHLSYIYESKKLGDTLVVIVNGDSFLKNKKGKAFMDLMTRCCIVSYVKGVDYVIPFEIENDQTVSNALQIIKPHIFTKGGDRVNKKNIPEWKTCKDNGIKIVTGVGFSKDWSSSVFLREWEEFLTSKIPRN